MKKFERRKESLLLKLSMAIIIKPRLFWHRIIIHQVEHSMPLTILVWKTLLECEYRFTFHSTCGYNRNVRVDSSITAQEFEVA
jgi:hypothetical protein